MNGVRDSFDRRFESCPVRCGKGRGSAKITIIDALQTKPYVPHLRFVLVFVLNVHARHLDCGKKTA